MKILIDPGHGLNTPGKRSPDGTLLEAAYNREIAQLTLSQLQAKGYDAQLLVPETEDIPLKERVRRVNAHCTALGKTNVILISIHVNAPGDGTRRHTATGWSCYTCKGHTHCPAVLIENFFMDNKKDLAYLLSQEGRRAIVETIIDGIERCVLTLLSG